MFIVLPSLSTSHMSTFSSINSFYVVKFYLSDLSHQQFDCFIIINGVGHGNHALWSCNHKLDKFVVCTAGWLYHKAIVMP